MWIKATRRAHRSTPNDKHRLRRHLGFADSASAPPSNKMTATAIDINGPMSVPRSRIGSKIPDTGPAMMHAANINTIAGICIRHATHCAPTPKTPTIASADTGSSPVSIVIFSHPYDKTKTILTIRHIVAKQSGRSCLRCNHTQSAPVQFRF